MGVPHEGRVEGPREGREREGPEMRLKNGTESGRVLHARQRVGFMS